MLQNFVGTTRFEVIRTLGAGGMGVVYEALDRERNTRVALKTLHSLTGEALLRFKNEFREFQDLQHPNLVSIGELFCENNEWFFSMELVDGISFLSYVRGGHVGMPSEEALSAETVDITPSDRLDAHVIQPSSSQGGVVVHEVRLRDALRQLALGLTALHDAGKVHRDIKPSNVLVTAQGRVVLLDFGLATDHAHREHKSQVEIVGTVEYMAPEQGAGRQVGPPADWYAVGIMLYEALTGQLPYTGTAMEVLMNKQRLEAPSPRVLAPNAPEDLSKLCAELLRFNPAARPTGKRVLEILGMPPAVSGASLSSFSTSSHFVGRERELFALREAFERARTSAQVVTVYGESGVGKSALVRRFSELTMSREPGVAILRGTCYERESVPFKAVDGVIDSLSRFMRRLPKAEAAALLPRRAGLLVQVFPVLARVEAVAEAPRTPEATQDPQELRSRLFGALRELFGRLTDRRPVLIVIDDLQWADADSLALLAELLRPPDAPTLLLVATVRSALRGTRPRFALPNVRELEVDRLPPAEARELATTLLARARAGTALKPHQIAQEADGHPLFIDELIRHACTVGVAKKGPLQLEDALWARVAQFDETTRKVLELVCLAGGRLVQQTAAHAAGLSLGEFAKQVALLRVAHLLRTSGMRGSDHVEPYHGRVRAAVVSHIDAATAVAHHRRLALALETSGQTDPEALAVHWREAGDREKAAYFFLVAAEKADRALAFDRAVQFYQYYLELEPAPPREVRVKLGAALANSGRGREAAHVYLAAATTASTREANELRRRAAEQLLRSGHVDEGLAVLRDVLAAVGMQLAPTPRRALLSLLARRARISLRGLDYRERDESRVAPETLTKIDTCWAAAACLSMVDTIRGADFQARHLLLALEAGEPYRIARALALEGGYHSLAGGAGAARAAAILDKAAALAKRIDHPHAIGLTSLIMGIAAFQASRWRTACERLAAAEATLRDNCTGVAWELTSTHVFHLNATYYVGRHAELQQRVPTLVKEAQRRGDRYATTDLRLSHMNSVWLAQDDAEAARSEAREAMSQLSPHGYLDQHFYALMAETNIDFYVGDGAKAYRRITEQWPAIKKAMMLRIQSIRVVALQMRAYAAILAAHSADSDLLEVAERDAAALDREGMEWATGFAATVRAAIAAARRNLEQAEKLLAAARDHFHSAEMPLFAAACSRHRGEILGGDEGRSMTSATDDLMAAQNIRHPERFAHMLVPGFRNDRSRSR